MSSGTIIGFMLVAVVALVAIAWLVREYGSISEEWRVRLDSLLRFVPFGKPIPRPSYDARCPTGYTNDGTGCYRPPDSTKKIPSWTAHSYASLCPSGYESKTDPNTKLYACYATDNKVAPVTTVARCDPGWSSYGGYSCSSVVDQFPKTGEPICSSGKMNWRTKTCTNSSGATVAEPTCGPQYMPFSKGSGTWIGGCTIGPQGCPNGYVAQGNKCEKTGMKPKGCPDGLVKIVQGAHIYCRAACKEGKQYINGWCRDKLSDITKMICHGKDVRRGTKCYSPCGSTATMHPTVNGACIPNCEPGYIYNTAAQKCMRPSDKIDYSAKACTKGDELIKDKCYQNCETGRLSSGEFCTVPSWK